MPDIYLNGAELQYHSVPTENIGAVSIKTGSPFFSDLIQPLCLGQTTMMVKTTVALTYCFANPWGKLILTSKVNDFFTKFSKKFNKKRSSNNNYRTEVSWFTVFNILVA